MKKILPKTKAAAWSAQELWLHRAAVTRLETILQKACAYLTQKQRPSEEALSAFIVERMRAAGLTSMLGWTIVAYGPSAADPHYHFKPGQSRRILPGHLLLLDIWGKLNQPNAPYADLTHMYFVGKNPPNRFVKLWSDLRSARDQALKRLMVSGTTKGATLHQVAKRHLDRCGHPGLFIHGLGHDLGVDHVHGPGANLNPKWNAPLTPGRAYTIEPGIYKPGQFGLRSEIDFFLDPNRHVQLTTRLQNHLECI